MSEHTEKREPWYMSIASQDGILIEEDDEFTKADHACGFCDRHYWWSADDISWEYEASPFMPCGHKWDFLDRVVE